MRTRPDSEDLVRDISLLQERLAQPPRRDDVAAGWSNDSIELVAHMLEDAKQQLIENGTGAKWAQESSLGRTLDMRWGICEGVLLDEVLGIGLRLAEHPKSTIWRKGRW
jgi:hypothetical protein